MEPTTQRGYAIVLENSGMSSFFAYDMFIKYAYVDDNILITLDKKIRTEYNKGKKEQKIMAKTTANISIDAETKAKAQALFADFGMDLSTAINIFLRQAIYENAIPFAITRNVPNQTTVDAMDEYDEMEKHPEKYKRYSTFKEAMKDVLDNA